MNTQLSGPYRREAPASPTDDEQTQQQNSLSDRGRRSRYAGLGCLTVMLVFLVSGLLLPGGRNKSKQQSELVSGVLASFDEEPPLITEAIKAKKEVVLLENTHSDVISGVDAIYFVLDGSDIDFIVEKFRVFRGSEHYWSAYPKGAVRNGDEGVEWTVTRMPSGMMARRNELSIVQKPNIVIVTKSSMAIEATWDPVGSGCSWTAECRMQQITDSKGQRFPKEKQGSIGGIGSRLSP